MILVCGSSADRVYPQFVVQLRDSGHPFVAIDEEYPATYRIIRENIDGCPRFHITGGDCTGTRPVRAVFVRHAVARTLDAEHIARLGTLQMQINSMLLATACLVINQPAKAHSNYSKPYQVGLLAAAGFDVPRSLVTTISQEARRFYDACGGRVIFKGSSNMTTLAQVLTPEKLARTALLPHCPTLFQEYVAGVDYRVHVVGERAFVTRLVSTNEDYRRSLLGEAEVTIESAELPADVVARCVAITGQLGLVVSGIDFKESPDGRLVALEINPYPQFTFYEGRSGQPIMRAVIDELVHSQLYDSDILA